LLNALDGSYLHCEKRLADAQPTDTIRFDDLKRPMLASFLASSQGTAFSDAIEQVDELIDGFQSPLGMEALATVDWLVMKEGAEPTLAGIKNALGHWPDGPAAAERKLGLFTDKLLLASMNALKRFSKQT